MACSRTTAPPAPPPEPRDPDVALMLAYAPAAARPALAALFALDERLVAVAARGGEPGLKLIRLAWWRDALDALGRGPPPAEPLLAALGSAGLDGARLADVADGWAALVEDGPGAQADHAGLRGTALFALAAGLLSPQGRAPDGAGAGWALAQSGRGDAAGRLLSAALARPWPRALRPLGLLVALRAFDLRRPGAPRRRMLRALRFMLAGR